MIRPSINWTLFSADDVRNAVRMFDEDSLGVRDELGFLAIHQVYADWFFPGTSTQQTRLRYLFFVPWTYQRILRNRTKQPLNEQLQRSEQQLVKQLRDYYQPNPVKKGIIGLRAPSNVAAMPPSISYWTLLRQWGITKLNRAELHSRVSKTLENRSGLQTDEDGDSLSEPDDLFHHEFPNAPGRFLKARSPQNKNLPTFDITPP